MDQRLTALAKQKAFELGADLVGVGNIERWSAAPPLMSPLGIMPDGRAVLVCAIHHTDAMIEVGARARHGGRVSVTRPALRVLVPANKEDRRCT